MPQQILLMTFGCQMNKHDSDRLAEVLLQSGRAICHHPDEADVIVLNTCSVREKAQQKLRSELGRLTVLKRRRPELILAVVGCVAQQEGRQLVRAFPAVDLVLGPDNSAELADLLGSVELGAPPIVRTRFDLEAPTFLTAPTVAATRPTAYVTTMKGCDERCSFCVVPATRGPERYRPSSEIIEEISQLVERGVKEITLLGQTVNSYRDPSGRLAPADGEPSQFAALLELIARSVPGLCRLRYTAPHPRHLSRSLIAAHQKLAVLCRHIHLPVQSGSDRILRRMIRRHTRAQFLAQVARLREAVPDVTISSDIIVGFCGETQEDFELTLSLVREAHFTGVFGFRYSPRPGTPALKLADDVPEPSKAERLQQLFELTERLTAEHLAGLQGTTQQVLVEGRSKLRPEHWTGRSGRNEIIHIVAAQHLDITGELVTVEVTEPLGHSLLAQLTAPERQRLGRSRPPDFDRALPVIY